MTVKDLPRAAVTIINKQEPDRSELVDLLEKEVLADVGGRISPHSKNTC